MAIRWISLLQVALISSLLGCVATESPLIEPGKTRYQPLELGYGQSCLVYRLEVSDCVIFRLESLGANSALLWLAGDEKPVTVAFEPLQGSYFLLQLSMKGQFAYLLAQRDEHDHLSVWHSSCRSLLAQAEALAKEGAELAQAASDTRCAPKNRSLAGLKKFFQVLIEQKLHQEQPVQRVRMLDPVEGKQRFTEAAAKKKPD